MGLALEAVSHAFDGPDVVRDVGLAVGPGDVACLLGPSGCGKTTLLRLAAGLEVLQRGRVVIGGRIVADGAAGLHRPPEDRRVGLMFQDYALFPHLTVWQNIVFGVRDRSAGRLAAIRADLERAGLAALASSYPHTLSGGEQQRCALLRALAPGPDVLLLDEPFSGLDVTLRGQVREQTLDMLRDSGIATLIVTHDPEEAMFMADRLFVMRDGAIVQSGTPAEIYLHPGSAFVAGLFGALNRVTGTVAAGCIETPLGTFETAGLADGAAAEVLVRPEAIILVGGPDGIAATVDSARLLGRSSHLRLAVRGLDPMLHARMPGVCLPAPGTRVAIAIRREQAFVFALDERDAAAGGPAESAAAPEPAYPAPLPRPGRA